LASFSITCTFAGDWPDLGTEEIVEKDLLKLKLNLIV
jgi:hypothetical protein